jgi:sec-independent protein translocase protein TatB
MELFGIGPTELLFIILLALIIFGPKDLEKAGRTLGRSLYKLIKSDIWQTLTQTSKKIKTLPNDLIKQAEQEVMQEKVDSGAVKSEAWKQDPRIRPPTATPPATPDVIIDSPPAPKAGPDTGSDTPPTTPSSSE